MTELHAMHYTKIHKRSMECREERAAAFFKDWREVILEASAKGAKRWQFQQNVAITFHDTNAAAKVTRAMGEHHLKMAWVGRCFVEGHPANPFGEPIYIKELLVWWHNGQEHIPEFILPSEGRWEGMPVVD